MKKLILIALLCLPALHAQVINYPSGFAGQPSTLWLENSAAYSGSSIEVTNGAVHSANNVWYKTPVNEQAFTTTFTFHFNCSPLPSDCGDGLGFMMVCACTSGNPTYNPPSNPGYIAATQMQLTGGPALPTSASGLYVWQLTSGLLEPVPYVPYILPPLTVTSTVANNITLTP